MIERLTIVKMLTLPKAIVRLNTIPTWLGKCISISNLLSVFIIEVFWILSHAFILSIDKIIQYLFLACWYVSYINWFLNESWISRKKLFGYSGWFFLYIVVFNLLIFFVDYFCILVHERYSSGVFLFFIISLCSLGIKKMLIS